MKTLSIIGAVVTASALIIGGCGYKTEEPKKPAEAPAPTTGAPATTPGTTAAPGAPGTEPGMMAGAQTVKGDLMKIDGEYYVVKDSTGKEVKLHVDSTSKIEGAPKAGDKVEAQMNPNGHATSIKKQ
jgi:hypothetical protein